MRGLKQVGIVVSCVALGGAIVAGPAAADYTQIGVIDTTSPTAVVPFANIDGSCIEGTEAYYATKSFTARTGGVHHLVLKHNSAFPTGVVVYDGSFDPNAPLTHCVGAKVVPSSGGTSTGGLDLSATRGHLYTVVVGAIAMTDYSLEIDEPDGAAAGPARGTGSRFVKLAGSLSCERLALVATWSSRAKEVRSAVFSVQGERVDLVRSPLPRDRSGIPVGLGDVTVKVTIKLTNGTSVKVNRDYLSC